MKLIKLIVAAIAFFYPASVYAHEEKSICDRDISNIEILECLSDHFSKLDEDRKKRELEVVEESKSYSVELKEDYEDVYPATVKSIEDFEHYRESECSRQMTLFGAGSLRGHAYIGCKITLTEERIEHLNFWNEK